MPVEPERAGKIHENNYLVLSALARVRAYARGVAVAVGIG